MAVPGTGSNESVATIKVPRLDDAEAVTVTAREERLLQRSRQMAVRRRRIRAATLRRSLISLVVGLGIWELVARYIVTNRTFFVPFSATVQRIWELGQHGALYYDIEVTAIELIGGYLCAVVIGVSVGTAMGLSAKVRACLVFWVDIFNATPVLALAPLFILCFGLGINSKIIFVAFVAVWNILLNSMAGFLLEDKAAIEMARSFGCTRWQEFKYVRVPNAIPTVAVGLRVAVGKAVGGVVVGELFGSTAGLGFLLFNSRDQFDTAGMFAAIAILALMALLAVNLMTLLERRLSRWRD
jgi:NitT/TauT family transport system permease protein